MYEAGGKDGVGSFDVCGAMYEGGEGSVEPKKLLRIGGMGRMLADVAQSSAAPTLTRFWVSLWGACCLLSLVKGRPLRVPASRSCSAQQYTCWFGEGEQSPWQIPEWPRQR